MAAQGEEGRRILDSLIQSVNTSRNCAECFESNAFLVIESNHEWKEYTGRVRIKSVMASMNDHLAAEVKMCIQTGLECYAEVQFLTRNLVTTRRWVHFTSEGGRIVFMRIFGERSMNSRDE
jgi:hypothetical protein